MGFLSRFNLFAKKEVPEVLTPEQKRQRELDATLIKIVSRNFQQLKESSYACLNTREYLRAEKTWETELRQILEWGANPNAQDHDGNPALLKAVRSAHSISFINELLIHGAAVNAQNKKGETALMEVLRKGGGYAS